MPDYIARYRIESVKEFEFDYGTVHIRNAGEFLLWKLMPKIF